MEWLRESRVAALNYDINKWLKILSEADSHLKAQEFSKKVRLQERACKLLLNPKLWSS